MVLGALYRPSLALATDLYQLTMAQGFFAQGLAERRAVYHLFFRRPPFGSGYTIAAGLDAALELATSLRFEASDLEYLAGIPGADGKPIFRADFLDALGRLRPTLDVDAIQEGTVVFAHEPLLRVTGPVLEAQLLETPLLNVMNFQTLIATKSARVCHAARGEPVLEFGLRRAQGIDGGLSASRAAYVGGAAATSNVLAGKLFGIPVRGTHAHSWVMFFDGELEAFERYADAMPNNCVFLVDTYDTLKGVDHAIEVGKRLRARGHDLLGVRLDSGDLAYLSIEARKRLDAAGFPKATIVASNDLDEGIIQSLKEQGAAIGVWGVGTKLATAYDQPALGGVYKLTAVEDGRGGFVDRVKLSEQAIKVSNPGIQQVRRFFRDDGEPMGDAIYDVRRPPSGVVRIVDPMNPLRHKDVPAGARHEDLLVPAIRGGRRVLPEEPLTAARDRARDGLARFHPGVKRLLNPHEYPVGLEAGLYETKRRLIEGVSR